MMRVQTRFVRAVVTAIVVGTVAAASCARRQTNRVVDPTNELPSGVVDGPVDGATVPVVTSAGGWAVDDRGIREVRLYVDGHFVNATPLNTARPDVAKVVPQYTRGTDILGWATIIEFPSPGPHTLLVQAVDSDGATRDIGTVKVTVK